MYTSNYWNYSGHNSVSIAGRCPDFYKGREYKKLAPLYWFFKKYKQDNDKKFYIEQYNNLILAKLNAEQIYNDLGKDSVILCWEKPGEFCHRRLVAEWFKKQLNIEVLEWK